MRRRGVLSEGAVTEGDVLRHGEAGRRRLDTSSSVGEGQGP